MGKVFVESRVLSVVLALKEKDWVHCVSRRRPQPKFEGLYIHGGRILGQFHPDVCYQRRHNTEVLVLINPFLNEKPFFVLLEDIVWLKIRHASVKDD